MRIGKAGELRFLFRPMTHGVLMFLIVTAWIAELIKGLKKLKMQLNYSPTTALVIDSRLWLLKLATYEIHY